MSEAGHTGQRQALNVLGNDLVPCSYDPVTGWYRDGCCHTRSKSTRLNSSHG